MFTPYPAGAASPGDTLFPALLKDLDPRAKTVACLLALVGMAGGPAWPYPALLLALAGAAFSGARPLAVARGLRPVLFLCLFGVLLHGLATPGEALAGWLPLTREGLKVGARLASQLALASALAALLMLTTPPAEIAAALAWLFRPLGWFKAPVEDFFRSVALAMALIPAIEAERARAVSTGAARRNWFSAVSASAPGALERLLREADAAALSGTLYDGRAGFRRFGFGEWLVISVAMAAGPAALAYL